ncbi:hypothetical protein SAMN05877838_3486 [Hoeflea halophila]|uniref:Uncharacterized protein n=1 Tax=Hoeflea halophila TaxID=714899 RepID=A0A286IEL2_9HYPH|nr:hypothetical protein SAMN05877838_3486 [Hoeflea halophila]
MAPPAGVIAPIGTIRFSRPPDLSRVHACQRAGDPGGGAGLWRRCFPVCVPCPGGSTGTPMHLNAGVRFVPEPTPKGFHRGARVRGRGSGNCPSRVGPSPQAVQRSRTLPVGCGHHPASFGPARACATRCMSLTCTPKSFPRRRPRAALRTPSARHSGARRVRRDLPCRHQDTGAAQLRPGPAAG